MKIYVLYCPSSNVEEDSNDQSNNSQPGGVTPDGNSTILFIFPLKLILSYYSAHGNLPARWSWAHFPTKVDF